MSPSWKEPPIPGHLHNLASDLDALSQCHHLGQTPPHPSRCSLSSRPLRCSYQSGSHWPHYSSVRHISIFELDYFSGFSGFCFRNKQRGEKKWHTVYHRSFPKGQLKCMLCLKADWWIGGWRSLLTRSWPQRRLLLEVLFTLFNTTCCWSHSTWKATRVIRTDADNCSIYFTENISPFCLSSLCLPWLTLPQSQG